MPFSTALLRVLNESLTAHKPSLPQVQIFLCVGSCCWESGMECVMENYWVWELKRVTLD